MHANRPLAAGSTRGAWDGGEHQRTGQKRKKGHTRRRGKALPTPPRWHIGLLGVREQQVAHVALHLRLVRRDVRLEVVPRILDGLGYDSDDWKRAEMGRLALARGARTRSKCSFSRISMLPCSTLSLRGTKIPLFSGHGLGFWSFFENENVIGG